MLLQLFLISALLTFDSATSNLDCFLDQQECELRPDNHLDTVTGLSNMIECLEQCNGDIRCKAFTFLAAEETCLLFSSCPSSERRPCENCSTGSSQTECLCGIDFQCEVDADNFVDEIPRIGGEQACKRQCTNNQMCKVNLQTGENFLENVFNIVFKTFLQNCEEMFFKLYMVTYCQGVHILQWRGRD